MAIDLEPVPDERIDQVSYGDSPSLWNTVKRILEPLASLKLTVALFAFSIVLILAGTFAQVDKDIWEVIGQYFRCWFAWISFPIFFPPSFVPEMPKNTAELSALGWFGLSTMHTLKGLAEFTQGIWFPGGKLIGLLLAANLLAAHLVRFKAVATGGRLVGGLAAIAIGCAVTWFIIASAGNSQSFQTDPWVPYSMVWIGFKGLLALACLGALFATATLAKQSPGMRRSPRRILMLGTLVATAVGLIAVLGWLLTAGDAARPADASLRILWQLSQGSLAAGALLTGCIIVFGKRAGIVLLHSGIGLMMFYELHVALTAVEMQMNLREGETSNFAHDIRTFELALVDKSKPGQDRVTVIPRSMITEDTTIDVADLPFRVEIKKFLTNSRLRRATASDKNLATKGMGLDWIVDEVKKGSGTDMGSKVDTPAVYVSLTERDGNKPIGTYLVAMLAWSADEFDSVQVGDKTYEFSLRPKRYYKSYKFTLKDVRKDDYIGTRKPRNYASTVIINDATRQVGEQEKTIWMNNPLRFADETFYQSSYNVDDLGNESTVLSVVANSGWMMPYVACMLVAIGMLAHFLTLLFRFLLKSDVIETTGKAAELAQRLGIKSVSKVEPSVGLELGVRSFDVSPIVAIAVVAIAGLYIASVATPPRQKLLDYDMYRFGQIPVVQDGRVKPLDSAAYSALLEISGRTYVEVGHDKEKKKLSATEWLADVIAGVPIAFDYEVFRVENLEVQETIGVKKREGMRYSRKEVAKNEEEFRKQVEDARAVARKDRRGLSVYQRKLLELSDKIATFDTFAYAFRLHHKIGGETQQEVIKSFMEAMDGSKVVEAQFEPVFVIAPTEKDQKWRIFSRAWLENVFESIQQKKERDPTVAAWDLMLNTYEETRREFKKDNDNPDKKEKRPQDFNKAVDAYLDQLDKTPPVDVNLSKTRFEAFFNHFRPFIHADRLYIVAFVLGALGWLGWTRGFNRSAFWLLCLIFAVHTFALVSRIYISGRPPVTNLYSSAIFIGWGCVALGLILEFVYRLGIGNLIASVAGYATLLIADGLSLGGDTFTVLEAVLDTQFWLATHVTTITLGYATTYLAGLLGLVYVLRGVFTPSLTPEIGRDLNRMIYGTLCFSIFFSFVGTVLGGLWADDSWGRFWGWDPKENGALIIVLWNALVLHARWGGMIKERGMAVMAIAGNIFVSWSWWGVNELGAGLHSYGFTEGTVTRLGLFVLSQLILVGIGLIPKHYWWSFRRRSAA